MLSKPRFAVLDNQDRKTLISKRVAHGTYTAEINETLVPGIDNLLTQPSCTRSAGNVSPNKGYDAVRGHNPNLPAN